MSSPKCAVMERPLTNADQALRLVRYCCRNAVQDVRFETI